MSTLNLAVYTAGYLYPETDHQPVGTTITELQESGFTTVILGLFLIAPGKDTTPPQTLGDIHLGKTPIISNGSYVGDPSWPDLVDTIIGGTVTQVSASVGGGGTLVFTTIQKIYEENHKSFAGTNLMKNFTLLRSSFPAISIIDMDCEDAYDPPSFVAFCQMLIGMGFDITFCPYGDQPFWIGALKTLHSSNPGAVKWWNLQCYDGGDGNDPDDWAAAISQAIPGFPTTGYILASDTADDSPTAVQSKMEQFRGEDSVGGGFIWELHQIVLNDPANAAVEIKAYAQALSSGLSGASAESQVSKNRRTKEC